ncbi:hypothetical protein T492DRAFT_624352 [Pavlovales sp. CCMP2436]|nr:hypothetical protein T492DRAFT_624352 [Pavlovales sp. CCMP2436]
MIALRTKADDTFIALLALAPVKPGAPLLALWRARALYSAAAAAEAVAVEGDDDGDASAHAAGLLAEARRDASLIVRLETGQLYAMAMLDMSYMPEDMAVDAAAQQALQALSLGDHGQATRTALAAEDADGARAFAAGMPTLARGPVPRRTVDAHRQARTDLQGALIGIPRHMGIMPQTVRDSLQRARDRPWPAKTGSDSAAPPMTPPVTPKSNVGDPPSGSPRSSPRSSQHAEWPSAPLTTEQLLLRTCIESDGYAVVISEMGSRDQPLVYINAGFAAGRDRAQRAGRGAHRGAQVAACPPSCLRLRLARPRTHSYLSTYMPFPEELMERECTRPASRI